MTFKGQLNIILSHESLVHRTDNIKPHWTVSHESLQGVKTTENALVVCCGAVLVAVDKCICECVRVDKCVWRSPLVVIGVGWCRIHTENTQVPEIT